MPVVSVVMPVFNAGRFLEDSLTSIVAQSFYDWELIAVDDCSEDGSYDLLVAYAQRDSRITLIRHPANGGTSAARNTGLHVARGKYIAFLDSDDLWHPEKLAIQVQFMENSGAILSYMSYLRMTEEGVSVSLVQPPTIVDHEKLLDGNVIGLLTAMYLRSSLHNLRFTPHGHEDYLFWLAALKRIQNARVVPTCEPLAYYRVRQASLSSRKLVAARWQWQIYRNHLNLGLATSMKHFSRYAYRALRKRL